MIGRPPDNLEAVIAYCNFLSKQPDSDAARNLLYRLLESQPDNPNVLLLSAIFWARRRDMRRADDLFQRAVQVQLSRASDDTLRVAILHRHALAAAAQPHTTPAADLFSRALEIDPNNIAVLTSYAKFLRARDDLPKAAQLLDRALELQLRRAPDDATRVAILTRHALAAAAQPDTTKAAALFDHALEIDPNNIALLTSYAEFSRDRGDLPKAAQLLNSTLELQLGRAPDAAQLDANKAVALLDRALEAELRQALDDSARLTILTRHAQAAAKQPPSTRAPLLFDRALTLKPDNVGLLTSYARFSHQQGDTEKAAELFDRALSLKPDNVDALTSYASLSHEQGHDEKANSLFHRAMQVHPNHIAVLTSYSTFLRQSGDIPRAQELSHLALETQLRDQPDDAARATLLTRYAVSASASADQSTAATAANLFDRALELQPTNLDVLTTCANALLRDGQITKALPLLQRAFDLRPDDVRTLNAYANALLREGDTSKALPLLERAVTVEPQDARNLSAYANALLRDGQTTKAMPLLHRALELQPHDVRTLNAYANALLREGDTSKALPLLERAVTVEPQDARNLSAYANALLRDGQTTKAMPLLHRALELQPHDVRTLNAYANALLREGDTSKALALLEPAVTIEPHNVRNLTAYATALLRTGDATKALSLLDRALELEPNEARNLSTCAHILAKHGATARAFSLFDRALVLQPNDTRTLSHYASALLRRGDSAKAHSLLERAVSISPDSVRLLNTYASALLRRGDNTDRVLELLDHAIAVDPTNAVTLTTYASAMERYGNVERSLELLRKAVEVDPENVITLSRYANSLARNHRTHEARHMLDRAEQIASGSAVALYWIAKTFQILEEPRRSVEALEKLLDNKSYDFDDFIVRLTLGQLYFQLGRTADGLRQFDTMLQQAHDTDAAKLRIVRQMMIVSPHVEYANKLLNEIADTSPRHTEAQEALGLNLDSDSHFQAFGQGATGRIPDQATLNRTLYHNINGHIAILKETLHEMQRGHDNPILRDLVSDISTVLQGIKDRRASIDEGSRSRNIGHYDYQDTLDIIANTAHDIVDFVGNEIGVIREDLLLSIAALPLADREERRLYSEVNRSVSQTLGALNDLKRINEGIHLRYSEVSLRELLDPWLRTPTLRDGTAQIRVWLNAGGDDVVTVDVQKVRGFLNELIANSLKHNRDSSRLSIEISASIMPGLPFGPNGSLIEVPGERYLSIYVSDNGKGIESSKKNWIFQPLTTTAGGDEGSGLGLFDIRRTIEKMRGFIHETGVRGARFGLYIRSKEAKNE